MTAQSDAERRRQHFIDDIIEVCRKHNVLIRIDEDIQHDDECSFFEEHGGDGFDFVVCVADLEDAVRKALWDSVHKVSTGGTQ